MLGIKCWIVLWHMCVMLSLCIYLKNVFHLSSALDCIWLKSLSCLRLYVTEVIPTSSPLSFSSRTWAVKIMRLCRSCKVVETDANGLCFRTHSLTSCFVLVQSSIRGAIGKIHTLYTHLSPLLCYYISRGFIRQVHVGNLYYFKHSSFQGVMVRSNYVHSTQRCAS